MHAVRTCLAALLAAALWAGAGAGAGAAEEPGAPSSEAQAVAAWQEGYVLHVLGEYERAAEKFRESIALHPSAEGHTFLGWSLSELGRLEDAIAECERAIALDPDYGNPYNDVGVYLMELGRLDEAVPWLEKAMQAERYCCYQFPYFNFGRIQMLKGRVELARQSFRRALEHDPSYTPALRALEFLDQHGIRGL